jgi:hypothetical protein
MARRVYSLPKGLNQFGFGGPSAAGAGPNGCAPPGRLAAARSVFGGATANVILMEHFQKIAEGHFIVRLERF